MVTLLASSHPGFHILTCTLYTHTLVQIFFIFVVCDDHDFKDGYLFYRFCNDEKTTKEKKLDLRKLLSNSPKVDKKSQAPTPPERKRNNKGSKLFKGESVYANPDETISSSKGAFLQSGDAVSSSIEEEDE